MYQKNICIIVNCSYFGTDYLRNAFCRLHLSLQFVLIVLVPRAPPLQVTAFNTSNSSILVTWQDITSSSVPGILLGYVLRISKADDTNFSNFREIEHDSSTNKTVTDLETYTLYKISVAGYTRVGIGNFSETQSWTDEGGEESYK